jgi:hypothetical protein
VAIILLRLLIDWLIPDVPRSVTEHLQRQLHIEDVLINGREDTDDVAANPSANQVRSTFSLMFEEFCLHIQHDVTSMFSLMFETMITIFFCSSNSIRPQTT